MSTLAATRPHSWDVPLVLHIFGGMLSVGALTLCLFSLVGALRTGSEALTRLGFRALLWGAVPGFVILRGAAQWIAHKEGLDNDNVDLTWLNIGFTVTDAGLLFLIVATVLGGFAVRRVNQGGGVGVSARISAGLVTVLLVAYLVAVWAMTAKPT